MQHKLITAWLRFKDKLPVLSIAMALTEVSFIWGLVFFSHASQPYSAHTLRLASQAWILCGLGSIVFAIAAMVIKPRPKLAPLALAVAILAYFVCGLPMLV